MGWYFTKGATRSDVINELNQSWENEDGKGSTIRSQCVGNVMWTVREYTKKATGEVVRYIGCDLLSLQNGYGWGYKPMDESMGPSYYTCPLSYFDLVPDPGAYATEWRKRVRAEHAKRNQRLYIGQVLTLEGCTVKSVTLTSLRPLAGYDERGKLWKIPRRFLPGVEGGAT